MHKTVAIIGVGYVGLELAIVFSKADFAVIAYDCSVKRIKALRHQIDSNNKTDRLYNSTIFFTHESNSIANATHYIVAVPTPAIEETPDLTAVKNAAATVGQYLKKGDLVVLESTVYPGTTDDVFIPILEQNSGLISGLDFFVGYCSERIDPGSEQYDMANFFNVVSGQNKIALARVKRLYKKALPGRIKVASSMKVAESSKLLENIQRDVNVALLNEYAEIMEQMNISFRDVLDVAKSKWNFLPFRPGLVGGHCIPIDPYYLIYKAAEMGIKSPLITMARHVNERFVYFIACVTLRQLHLQGFTAKDATVAILGLSYKINVSDTRHSLSLELYKALKNQGVTVFMYDPIANEQQHDINRVDWDSIPPCDALVLAQGHDLFLEQGMDVLCEKLNLNGVFIDIQGAFAKQKSKRDDIDYWSL